MVIKIKIITILFLILLISSLSIRATNHLSGSKPYSDMNQEERREYLSSLGFNVFNEKNSNGITPDDVEISNDGVVVTITKNGNTKSQKNPIDLSNLKGERTIKLSEGGKLKDKTGNQYNFGKGSADIKIVNGEIILKNAVLRKGSLIDGNQVQGTIESYDSKTKTLISQQGKGIVFNGREYSIHSASKVKITSDSDSFTIFGQSVVVKDSNNILFEFSGFDINEKSGKEIKKPTNGQITFHKDDHMTLGQKTEYVEYEKGLKSNSYYVDKQADLYFEKDKCTGKVSCIEKDSNGEIKVSAKGDTKIRIEAFDNSVKSVRIDEIADKSKVSFKKDKGELFFSSQPLIMKGDVTKTGVTFYTVSKGNEYSLNFKRSGRTGSTVSEQQFLDQLKYLLDNGYDIYDISRGIEYRDWTYGGKMEPIGEEGSGKFVGIDHSSFVWDGPEGRKYVILQDSINGILPPFVNIDGELVKINHAFAGIAAAANTPSWLAPFKTYAFTTLGDNYQVYITKMVAYRDYYPPRVYGTLLGGDYTSTGKMILEGGITEQKFNALLKKAENQYTLPEYKANLMGRNIAPQVRGKNSDEIVNLFKQEFEKIKKEQKK